MKTTRKSPYGDNFQAIFAVPYTLEKIFLLFLFIVLFSHCAFAQNVIESKYCTIQCYPEVDIEKVNKRIRIGFDDISFDKDYSLNDIGVGAELAEKFDRLFQKVEKILDMYPRKIHITVNIYISQDELDKAYFNIFGEENKEKRISYYVHKYTTIYTTANAISDGVIAHEIGHAVLDHYFIILPPETVAEVLAQYVELHMED